MYVDGQEATLTMQSSILISTMVHSYEQTLNTTCLNGTTACAKLWEWSGEAEKFIFGIENFTLLIDHSVQVDELGISKSSENMRGYLFVNGTNKRQQRLCQMRPDAFSILSNPESLTDKAPCYLVPSNPPGSELDFFSVGTLLNAAGVDLDQKSAPKSNH